MGQRDSDNPSDRGVLNTQEEKYGGTEEAKGVKKQKGNMSNTGENQEEKRKGYAQLRRQKAITSMSGNTTTVHPLEAVTLGLAVVVVAGNKIYLNGSAVERDEPGRSIRGERSSLRGEAMD